MAKVAVITPTYNRGDNGLLERTMLSVLGQTYPDFVHIVVDDGSTDRTSDLVGSYAGKDPRVVYVRRERKPDQKLSASGAINTGFDLVDSSGRFDGVEYVTFLHSDDMFARNSLERRVDVLDDSGCQAVYGLLGLCHSDMSVFHIQKALSVRDPVKLAVLLKRFFGGFTNHTLMLRKDLWRSVGGFDENLGYGEDLDFSVRTLSLLSEGEVAEIPGVLVFYRQHDGSITAVYTSRGWRDEDRRYFMEKHGVTLFDRMKVGVPKFLRRPHSYLPEVVKKPLRPVRDVVKSWLSQEIGERDPFIEGIELQVTAS